MLVQAIWQSITRRKMYLTGGIGSTAHGEAFTQGLRSAQRHGICGDLRRHRAGVFRAQDARFGKGRRLCRRDGAGAVQRRCGGRGAGRQGGSSTSIRWKPFLVSRARRRCTSMCASSVQNGLPAPAVRPMPRGCLPRLGAMPGALRTPPSIRTCLSRANWIFCRRTG